MPEHARLSLVPLALALALILILILTGCSSLETRSYPILASSLLADTPWRSTPDGKEAPGTPDPGAVDQEVERLLSLQPAADLPARLALLHLTGPLGEDETGRPRRGPAAGGGEVAAFGDETVWSALSSTGGPFSTLTSANALSITGEIGISKPRMADLRRAAAALGADLLLVHLVGTNRYRRATASSVLDLTGVGIALVPSREIEVYSGAKGVVVDVRTGAIVLAAEARRKASSRAPSAFVERETERLTEETERAALATLTERILSGVRDRLAAGPATGSGEDG